MTGLVTLGASAAPAAAHAQGSTWPGRIEILPVRSQTLPLDAFLRGDKAGIAAFILDSFSGRSIVSTVEDQDQLNSLSMTLDASRTLDALAAHPCIRPDRIAVWGFSKGAVPAVHSALERFRASFGSQNRFAAHVGFHTPCNIAHEKDDAMGGEPIRLYHGSSDGYVNPAACRALVSLEEGPNGTLLDAKTGQPYGLETASCVVIDAKGAGRKAGAASHS